MPVSPLNCRSIRKVLPDVLKQSLQIIFVGTAAGERSACEVSYYAHPGNRFWKVLREVELTPKLYLPHEYRGLLALKIGFTDLCKTQQGRDEVITDYDRHGLARKIKHYRPRIVALTSKKAASVWYARSTKDIAYGRQAATTDGGPIVFVLPSPSGAASGHWQIKPWRALADLLAKHPRLSRTARSPG